MPNVNVPFSAEEHRALKATAAGVGLYEKEILRRCFYFANWIATARVSAIINGGDKNRLDLGGVMEVMLRNTPETNERMMAIDSLGNRLRQLELLADAFCNSEPEDWPKLHEQCVALSEQGPWRDPR